MALKVKHSGVWKDVQQVFIKDSGSWKNCLDVQINDGGTWKSALYEPGSQNYTSAGTFSLTVPAGVSTMTVSVYAGGGGGSACWFCGDGYPGGGGGSGGYQTNQSLSVTPGESLSVVVGAAGAPGSFVLCSGTSTGRHGYPGGSSSVTSGSGLVSASGGAGGIWSQPGGGGAGGSPNGANGGSGSGLYGGSGGNNGTGYGTGGRGGNLTDSDPNKGGRTGYAGAVLISW